jgi:peroxiredoxin
MAEQLVGKKAPSLVFTKSDNTTVSLEELLQQGQPIAIDFYTTW